MRIRLSATISALVLLSASATAQVPVSPTRPPQITATGPQRPQPPIQQKSAVPIAQSPQQLNQAQMLQGVLSGYVYWDSSAIQSNGNPACQGFSVTVSKGTLPSGGQIGFEQFTALGTYKNSFSGPGKIGNYVTCTYSVDRLPTNTDLQVIVHIPSSDFKATVISNPPTVKLRIPAGNCMHGGLGAVSVADLQASWGSCGPFVYNVNFVLQPPQNLPGLTGNSSPMSGQSKTPMPVLGQGGGMRNSGPSRTQQMLLTHPGPTGMLGQGALQSPGVINPSTGHNASSLNPQPLPPRTTPASTPGGSATHGTIPMKAIKLSLSHQSRKITNPKAARLNNQIILVLEKQTQAAEAEIAAMKLGIRPAGPQTGPLQTMAARTAAPLGTGGATAQATVLPASSPQTGQSKFAAEPAQLHNLVVTCGHDPTMRVLTLSGGQSSAVFTQDPKYNFYTISGCSFGDPGPNAKAYIYSQGTFREDFKIEEWSDNWLKLSIDPSLSGVDDQSNVTLVIQREDGKQASKSGFSFYAARETILVPQIPKQYFSLNRFRPDSAATNSWNATYTSGSSATVMPNLPGFSAEVHWDLTTGTGGSIPGGSDIYDFGQLHSTFVLDSASMEWADVSCSDPNYNQFATSGNNWSIDWYQSAGVQVSWQGQVCNPTPGSCGNGFPIKSDCFLGPPQSNYGVDVWVTGPRGLDPWTGKPRS